MSIELREIKSSRRSAVLMGEASRVSVTSFWGGEVSGRCIQLTLDGSYIGLTEADVKRLMSTLAVWLDPGIQSDDASEFFKAAAS